MIRTELVLEKDWEGPKEVVKVLLVEDDPRLYTIGRMLEHKHCKKACLSVVSRHDMFHRLRDLTSKGMSPVALVWSADLEEERLSGFGEDLQVIGRVDYYDEEALFGRPTLTLLSRGNTDWRGIVQGSRVLLDRSYPQLSTDYIISHLPGSIPVIQGETGGYDLELTMLYGSELLDSKGYFPLDRVFGSVPVLVQVVVCSGL